MIGAPAQRGVSGGDRPRPRSVPDLLPDPAPGPTVPRRSPEVWGHGSEPVLSTLLAASAVIGLSTFIGAGLLEKHVTLLHNRMLPWILGRSLGVACYVVLTALVAIGLWLRHPWRTRVWSPGPNALLRAHVVLAASAVTLLIGHLTALALDHYAGVGWTGAFVPWGATYRPTAVALGTLGLYAMVLVASTALLAGWVGGRVWFPIHAASALTFALVSAHAVLAGSDTHGLLWMYVLAATVVVVLQASGWACRYAGVRAGAPLE